MWCNQCEQEILHSPWEVEKASSMETSSGIGKFLFRQNINILVQYFNRNRCYKRVIIRGNNSTSVSRNKFKQLFIPKSRFPSPRFYSSLYGTRIILSKFSSIQFLDCSKIAALGLIRLHPSNFFPWLRLGKQGNYQKNERRETSAPSLLLPGRHTGR